MDGTMISTRMNIRYPMHTLVQAQSSLLQAKCDRQHNLISEAVFQILERKLEQKIKQLRNVEAEHDRP